MLILTNNKYVIVTTDSEGDIIYDIYSDDGGT